MRVISTVAILLLTATALAAQGPEAARAANSITPQDIQRRIEIIADDSMRGRNTPSPELDEVANYIAGEFRSFGLAPGGDHGSYLQRYAIEQVRLDTARSVIAVAGGPEWHLGRDAVVVYGQAGPPTTAGVVVVDGSGSDTSAVNRTELHGRVVIVFVPPAPADMAFIRAVFSRGPAMLVLVQPNRPDALWERMVARQTSPMTRVGHGGGEGGPIAVEMRAPTLLPVLARAGYDTTAVSAGSTRPLTVTALPGLKIRIDLRDEVLGSKTAPNVVGILRGSDPVLQNQYVVFSAHMDHLGVGTPVNGDSIYNGADDDASGTIGVVELAEAFSRMHPSPRRSLIFLTVSGEEKGLWGSSWFTSHPPVPIDQIVADLNSDMIGRNWRDTIVVIGKEQSDLGTTLARVDSAHPELDMTAIDDIWPSENFYSRSDHFNFARRGVPILFFFNGTHADYHRPSDEPAKIDAEKESRIVKLVFYLGLDVANAAQRPQWNPESYREIVTRGSGN